MISSTAALAKLYNVDCKIDFFFNHDNNDPLKPTNLKKKQAIIKKKKSKNSSLPQIKAYIVPSFDPVK